MEYFTGLYFVKRAWQVLCDIFCPIFVFFRGRFSIQFKTAYNIIVAGYLLICQYNKFTYQ